MNTSKFQGIFIDFNSKESTAPEVGGCSFDVVSSITLLGVTIDSNLNLKQHVSKVCQKANTKISAFSRVSNYLDGKQLLILYNSQFNYCRLIWMFCGKVAK